MQIVKDPVRDVLRVLRAFSGCFKISCKIEIIRQHAGIVRAHLILLDEARALGFW